MHLMSRTKRKHLTAEERNEALAHSRSLVVQADQADGNGWMAERDVDWVRERCESFERLSGVLLEMGALGAEELWARVPEAERAAIDNLPSWSPDRQSRREDAIRRVRNSGQGWMLDLAGLQVGMDRILREAALEDAGKHNRHRRGQHLRLMLATTWLLLEATGMVEIVESSRDRDEVEAE